MNEVYGFVVDCGVSIWEYGLGWVYELQKKFLVGHEMAMKTFKNAFLTSVFMFVMSVTVFLILVGCILLSLIGSLAIRYYILSDAPEDQLLSLNFNTMPFETELWRLRNVNDYLSQLSPQQESLPYRNEALLMVSKDEQTNAPIISHVAEQAAGLKMTLIEQYVQNTVATSTLIIPSVVHKEVFPPGGGVSIEALFRQPKPMFNARGVYDAKMQFVFLKEDVGRDVSMVLDSTVLFAEDASVPQAVGALDVLLKTTTSFSFATGEKEKALLLWLMSTSFRFAFFIPVWIYETAITLFREDVFPGVDKETEFAVVVNVYSRFEPPIDLQPRLRAMNFTLYQQAGKFTNKARLLRMHFYSSVHLNGLAYYFSTYTISSFMTTALILLIWFCMIAGGFVLGVGALFVSLYLRNQRITKGDNASPYEYNGDDEDEDDDLGKDEEEDFVQRNNLSPPRISSPASLHEDEAISGFSNSRRISSFRFYEVTTPLVKEKRTK